MTKKDKHEPIRIISERIAPSFHIEADGRGRDISVLIAGVIGVKEFSDEEICITTGKESLKIFGKTLKITVFEAKTIEISGKIENISFSLRKGRRGNDR